MRVIRVPWTNYEVCINVNAVVNKKDYRRLLLAVFEHANDMHLYYNMMSYLIKGKYLEKKYGSKNFFFLLLFMAVGSTSLDVALCYLLSGWLESPYLKNACGIGFSGNRPRNSPKICSFLYASIGVSIFRSLVRVQSNHLHGNSSFTMGH